MQIIGKYFSVDSVKIDLVPVDWTGHKGLERPKVEDLEQMVDAALKFCARRSNKSPSEVERLIRSSDPWANSTFRYALAKEIRKILSSDQKFRDLYIMGSVMEDRARLNSDINLIMHVVDAQEDFQYWLVLLNEGLVKMIRERFGAGKELRTLLDCQVVTDEGVNQKIGYGALLSSTNTNLTRLS
jgi:predicted nucleotidyltransferase